MDVELIKSTVLSVKKLEKHADERDYMNILAPAKELSENAVSLISLAIENELIQCASDLRDSLKEMIASAKLMLKERTDESYNNFKTLLKDVSKALVNLTVEWKKKSESNKVSNRSTCYIVSIDLIYILLIRIWIY